MSDIDLDHIRTLVETNSRDLASHVPALLTALERAEVEVSATRAESVRTYERANAAEAEVERLREDVAHGRAANESLNVTRNRALNAMQAVRALHQRGEAYDGNLDYCERCIEQEGATWPCETIRALDTGSAS